MMAMGAGMPPEMMMQMGGPPMGRSHGRDARDAAGDAEHPGHARARPDSHRCRNGGGGEEEAGASGKEGSADEEGSRCCSFGAGRLEECTDGEPAVQEGAGSLYRRT